VLASTEMVYPFWPIMRPLCERERSISLEPFFVLFHEVGGAFRDPTLLNLTSRGSSVEAQILVRVLFCASRLSLILFFAKRLYSLFAVLR
jgi:hypothetical protein